MKVVKIKLEFDERCGITPDSSLGEFLKIVNSIGEMVEIKLGNIYMRVYPDSNLHDLINQFHAKQTIEVLEEKISNLNDVIDEYATGKR